MTRPAAKAALSTSNAASPRAIVSAFTKLRMPSKSSTKPRAAVVLPAPLGPARSTTRGFSEFSIGMRFYHGRDARNQPSCDPPGTARVPRRGCVPTLFARR